MEIRRNTAPSEIRTALTNFRLQAIGQLPLPEHPGVVDTSWKTGAEQDPSTWEPKHRTAPTPRMQELMRDDPNLLRSAEGRFLLQLDRTIIE